MGKLILNTEILSKMKVDLNRIYTGFDEVNEDILKIEEIVLKITMQAALSFSQSCLQSYSFLLKSFYISLQSIYEAPSRSKPP